MVSPPNDSAKVQSKCQTALLRADRLPVNHHSSLPQLPFDPEPQEINQSTKCFPFFSHKYVHWMHLLWKLGVDKPFDWKMGLWN